MSSGVQTNLQSTTTPNLKTWSPGDTGQYKIPFCFEDTYDQRSLTLTTLVPETLHEAPGGVASFLCTDTMMNSGICYRAVVRSDWLDLIFGFIEGTVNWILDNMLRALFGMQTEDEQFQTVNWMYSWVNLYQSCLTRQGKGSYRENNSFPDKKPFPCRIKRD